MFAVSPKTLQRIFQSKIINKSGWSVIFCVRNERNLAIIIKFIILLDQNVVKIAIG